MWANPTTPNLPDFLLFITNSMQIPASALPTVINPPTIPTLTPGSGGSLPSETVYVVATYTSLYGETTASPEASVAVTGATGQVTVTAPAATAGATGYNVYAANATGAEVLQTTSPVAIGANYIITALATGTATPPTVNTAGSPWPGYALAQAMALVLNIPTMSGLEYTLAVYNCAAHILLKITPDQPGQTYLATAREKFGILSALAGVINSASDQGTSDAVAVPWQQQSLTIGDLNFYTTPWGRDYLAFAQDFGAISGLT